MQGPAPPHVTSAVEMEQIERLEVRRVVDELRDTCEREWQEDSRGIKQVLAEMQKERQLQQAELSALVGAHFLAMADSQETHLKGWFKEEIDGLKAGQVAIKAGLDRLLEMLADHLGREVEEPDPPAPLENTPRLSHVSSSSYSELQEQDDEDDEDEITAKDFALVDRQRYMVRGQYFGDRVPLDALRQAVERDFPILGDITGMTCKERVRHFMKPIVCKRGSKLIILKCDYCEHECQWVRADGFIYTRQRPHARTCPKQGKRQKTGQEPQS